MLRYIFNFNNNFHFYIINILILNTNYHPKNILNFFSKVQFFCTLLFLVLELVRGDIYVQEC